MCVTILHVFDSLKSKEFSKTLLETPESTFTSRFFVQLNQHQTLQRFSWFYNKKKRFNFDVKCQFKETKLMSVLCLLINYCI